MIELDQFICYDRGGYLYFFEPIQESEVRNLLNKYPVYEKRLASLAVLVINKTAKTITKSRYF